MCEESNLGVSRLDSSLALIWYRTVVRFYSSLNNNLFVHSNKLITVMYTFFQCTLSSICGSIQLNPSISLLLTAIRIICY